MRKLAQTMAWVCCALLSGCDTMLPYNPIPREDYRYVDQCCTQRNFQSGYYYNGYQEHGWQYCVIRY